MNTVFSFFVRLFLCFVGAKFLLHAIDVEGRGYLVSLTILFLVNVYWFSYLVFRDHTTSPSELNDTPPPSPVAPEPTVTETQENRVPPEV
jgi:hypothetical protein